jgi:thymidylate synthase (FAD)
MTEIQFKSTIDVEVIQQCGSDEIIARAAWVLPKDATLTPQGTPITPEAVEKVLKFMIDKRHGTPFEHGFLTVRVNAPIKVWREWHRHRIGHSYNEESGRYKQLAPVFWIPPIERPMLRPEGFRSMNPKFELVTPEEYDQIVVEMTHAYAETYNRYVKLLDMGVDRGLARDVLGVGIFSACWVSCNPRSIMSFLELRTNCPEAKRPSKPLWEIDNAARQLETIFARYWPITHKLWNENGRMAP